MTSPVIGPLIRKDWRLHRLFIVSSVGAGAVALGVTQLGGEVPLVIGSVWLFVSLIVLGCMLPISAIVNERKKQNLAFLMSLPISSVQYTTAKLVSASGMFILPWLALIGSAFVLIHLRGILPQGTIPAICVLALMPVIGFCLISGAALVGESEGWSMAATLVCNSSYGLAWYLLARLPAINLHWKSQIPVWNAGVLTILFTELALIVLILSLTYFVQSRKRDFI